MTGDDFLVLDVDTEEFAYALRDVAVAGAVETVATYAVLLIVLVGEGIEVGFRRHGLVERGVEDCHLRGRGHKGGYGVDAGHVGGVVEGCDVVALFDHVLHLVVDKHAFAELLCSVDHAVTDGVDFLVVLDAAFDGVGEDVEDCLNSAVVVDEAEFEDGFRAVFFLVFEEAVGETDFLNTAFGEDSVV